MTDPTNPSTEQGKCGAVELASLREENERLCANHSKAESIIGRARFRFHDDACQHDAATDTWTHVGMCAEIIEWQGADLEGR